MTLLALLASCAGNGSLNVLEASVSTPTEAKVSLEDGYSYPMTLIKGGVYTLGCTSAQDCTRDRQNDGAARQFEAEITHSFYIGNVEVSRDEQPYSSGELPSYCSEGPAGPCRVPLRKSWYDAIIYANKLSVASGLEQCYEVIDDGCETVGIPGRPCSEPRMKVAWPKATACAGYRLPTAAEWEAAARGSQDTLYAGSDRIGAVGLCERFRAGVPGYFGPGRIGLRQPNERGLFDMSGNVAEWVWDQPQLGAEFTGRLVDPTGDVNEYVTLPENTMNYVNGRRSKSRMTKGGHATSGPNRCTVSSRYSSPAGLTQSDVGFRLVRSAL